MVLVIILKICLLIYIFLLGISAKEMYKEYKESKKTEEYDNSNLFGKILVNTISFVTFSAIAGMIVFLLYIISSKISIEWWF